MACDKCEVWQHVACLNLSPGTENKEFVCDRCLYRERTGNLPVGSEQPPVPTTLNPKITIKLKLPSTNNSGAFNSPIRLKVPDSRNESNPLPPSPQRSPSTVDGHKQHPPQMPDTPPSPPSAHENSQQPDLETPAAADTYRVNGSTELPPLQVADGGFQSDNSMMSRNPCLRLEQEKPVVAESKEELKPEKPQALDFPDQKQLEPLVIETKPNGVMVGEEERLEKGSLPLGSTEAPAGSTLVS